MTIKTGCVTACCSGRRAVEGIVPYTFVPGSEPDADRRFGVVDPGVDLIVGSPVIKRAMGECPSIRVYPVINSGHLREIDKREVSARLPPASRKTDPYMQEDVLAVIPDPWDKILRYPVLAPSPLLATLPALYTILDRCHAIPRNYR